MSSESAESCYEEADETDSDGLDVGLEGPVDDPPFSMFDEDHAAGDCRVARGLLQGTSVTHP